MENQALSSTVIPEESTIARLIFNNIDERIVYVDKNLNICFASRKAIEDTELLMGRPLVFGMPVLSLADPQRYAMLIQLYKEVLRGKEHKTEMQFPAKDGSVKYFENYFKAARNELGEIVGIIITSIEVTEKRRTEKKLQEAEERWRFALEGSNTGVWDWNLQQGICHYSSGYYKMYGYAPGELDGSFEEWKQRLHPDDRDRVLKLVEHHIQSKEKFVETRYRLQAKNGDYVWIEAKGLLLMDEEGKPARMIGTHTDLTDKIKNEEALQRSIEEIRQTNERFNIMMKATNDLIWDWDVKNNTFYRGEEGLKKVYGTECQQEIATIEKWMKRVHPEDLQQVKTVIETILKPGEVNTFELEYRFKTSDNNYFHVYDRGLVLRNENGEAVRIIGAAQNISDRKKLETEMLQKEIEHKRIINKATIDSQEKERSEIGRELHDNVNQLLTTTKLMLELAAGTTANKDDLLQRSIQNLSSAINEIRQLSRSLMDPTIHDLGIIDSINELAESINLTKKLQVIFTFENAIEQMLCKNQKLALFRIIQESLNNVLKHAHAHYAIISLCFQQEEAELVIEDDGAGFHPQTIRKGAGLKNIENRVFLINGVFNIVSQPGKGTKLIIKFPLNKQDQ